MANKTKHDWAWKMAERYIEKNPPQSILGVALYIPEDVRLLAALLRRVAKRKVAPNGKD